MTERITERDLEAVVRRINLMQGENEAAYTREADGTFHANVGTFCLSGAYGGWQLQRIMNEGGGVTCPIGDGYWPKRDLYNRMQAFIRGLEVSEDA